MLAQLLAKECSNCVHPQFQHRRLQQLFVNQKLLRKAEEMVEIVSIYPAFDEFDVELGPDGLNMRLWLQITLSGITRNLVVFLAGDSTDHSTIGQPTACVYIRVDWLHCSSGSC